MNILDSARPRIPPTDNQMCARLQAMLSYGKYQTAQIPSNISYSTRFYGLNFLTYSPIDEILIFVEPKHEIHVYNGQTIRLMATIPNTDVAIAASCASLLSESPNEPFFIYQTYSNSSLISLRVCQVYFEKEHLNFEDTQCIDAINVQYDQPDLRINGFTIKRDHAGTKNSLLFISTDLGLVYTTFATETGSIIGEPMILNETLNEGSIVVTSGGSIYFASKQENLIYELYVTRDFGLRYGKIIKANAIKQPFGLITDECNHLYIATRSMILVMFVKTYATIRSVFSKSSDLPIALERLNSTTYVYATIKKNTRSMPSHWMFNFLYFTEGEKILLTTRTPDIFINEEEPTDLNNATVDNATIPILWPTYLLPYANKKTRVYTKFFSTERKASTRSRTLIFDQDQRSFVDAEVSQNDDKKLPIQNTSTVPFNIAALYENQSNQFDHNHTMADITKPISPDKTNDSDLSSEFTTEPIISDDDFQALIKDRTNLSQSQERQIQAYLRKQALLNRTNTSTLSTTAQQVSPMYIPFDSMNTDDHSRQRTHSQEYSTKIPIADNKFSNQTIDTDDFILSEDDLQSFLEGRGNFSKEQEERIRIHLNKQNLSNIHNIHATDKKLYHKYQRNKTRNDSDPTKESLFDSEDFSHIIDTQDLPFSHDDLRLFLENRSNLSLNQQKQMEVYLNQLSRYNKTIFSTLIKNLTASTTLLKEHFTKLPLLFPLLFNHTIDIDQYPFTEDDLRAYIEGRSNLSKSQEAQIEAYLNRRLSFGKNISSTHHSVKPDSKSPYDKLSSNNQSRTDSEIRIFSDDDLKSFLEGRANLSKSQKAQIESYLAQPLPNGRNRTLKHPITNKLPIGINSTDGSIYNEHEPTLPEDYDSHTPQSQYKRINGTDHINYITFSDEELRSLLDDRVNLSPDLKNEIQAYLNKRLSLGQNTSSIHDSTTKTKPGSKTPLDKTHSIDQSRNDSETRIFSDDDLKSFLEGRANLSNSQKAQIEAYLSQPLPKDHNRTLKHPFGQKISPDLDSIDDNAYNVHENTLPEDYDSQTQQSKYNRINQTEHLSYITFSDEELRSLLNDRVNLSTDLKKEIQAYLNKRLSLGQNTSSTHHSDIKVKPDSKKPLDKISSDNQQQTESETRIFSDDDLKSFLEGRANLAESQKAQIEAYLSQALPNDRNRTLKHPITHKLPIRNDSTGSQVYNIHEDEDTLSYLTHINRTDQVNYITFSDDELRSLLEGRVNLSPDLKKEIQAYLNKRLSSSQNTSSVDDSKTPFNKLSSDNQQQTESETRIFSDDDLTSFLEGRANLTKSQKAQIEAYLSQALPNDRNRTLKHPIPHKLPIRNNSTGNQVYHIHEDEDTPSHLKHSNRTDQVNYITFSDDELRSLLEDRVNLSPDLKKEIQAYLNKRLSLAQNTSSTHSSSTSLDQTYSNNQKGDVLYPNYFNETTDSQAKIFTEDDLISFLEGRANLSKSQKAQIEAYLAQSSPNDRNRTLKHPFSFKLPIGVNGTGDNEYTTPQDHEPASPISHLKHSNRTDHVNYITFSDEELRSLLEDRVNLSPDLKKEIQAYLNKRLSLSQNISSTHLSATKIESGSSTTHDPRYSDKQKQETEFGYHSNGTADSQTRIFSDDDLKSFVEGRANLSKSQKAQIEAYLAQPIPRDHNRTLKHPISQTLPMGVDSTVDSKDNVHDGEYTIPQDHESGSSLSNFKRINQTDHVNYITFSDDELRSLLEDRVSLSPDLKNEIQAYLNKRLSLGQNSSSIHDSTTKTKPGSKTPLDKTHSINQSRNDSETRIFSDDDLKSFLEGRANLSNSQKAQIEAYLSQPLPKDHNRTLKHPISSKLPTKINSIDNNTQSVYEDGYDNKPGTPRSDWTHTNVSDDINYIIFSDEELRSLLKDRVNLSPDLKKQIESYLHAQSLAKTTNSSINLNSTTMRSEIHMSDDDTYYKNQKGITTTFDRHTKTPILDAKSINRSMDVQALLFSDEDLQSFLEGRVNLSTSQKTQIEQYLLESALLNQTRSLRHPIKGKQSTTLDALNGTEHSIYENEDTHAYTQSMLTKKPLSDSKSIDSTNDTEEILFSEDDLRLLLQNRVNLSQSQKAHIEAYLSKQLSSTSKIFSKNITSIKHHDTTYAGLFPTKKPFRPPKSFNRTVEEDEAFFSNNDLQAFLEDRANLSQNQKSQIAAYLSGSENQTTLSKFSANGSTSVRLPLPTGIQYSQSEANGSSVPLTESKNTNRTTVIQGILFSDDNLRAFLDNRANLSQTQRTQIKAYLDEYEASNDFTVSNGSTKIPKQPKHYFPETSIVNSENSTSTLNVEEITFSEDDLLAFLENRANLSEVRRKQIETYLKKKNSTDQNTFSKHPASKQHLDSKHTPDENDHSEYQNKDSFPVDGDSKNSNQTLFVQGVTYSDDDLRSFLEGRANLSKEQKLQIEKFLEKQGLNRSSLFSSNSTKINLPIRTNVQHTDSYYEDEDNNTNLKPYSTKLPRNPSYLFNTTLDFRGIHFSEEDLKSFLENRANLSDSQKAQIKAYLSQHPSLLANDSTLSKYQTSSPSSAKLDSRGDQVGEERKSISESNNVTHTIDSQGIIFTDDDLRSFLENRANLSKNQKLQIQIYLDRQFALNQSILSNYSIDGKFPEAIYLPNGEIYYYDENKRTYFRANQTMILQLGLKAPNASDETLKITVSEDDVQAYLQGRKNFSLTQQAEIQAYLAQRIASNKTAFSQYLTGRETSTKVSSSQDELNLHTTENLLISTPPKNSRIPWPWIRNRTNNSSQGPSEDYDNKDEEKTHDLNRVSLSPIHSTTIMNTASKHTSKTQAIDEYFKTLNPWHRSSTTLSSKHSNKKVSDINLMLSTSPIIDSSTLYSKYSLATPREFVPTNDENTYIHVSSKSSTHYPLHIDVDQAHRTPSNTQSITISSILQRYTLFENQPNINEKSESYDTTIHSLNDKSELTTDTLTHIRKTSTLSTLTKNDTLAAKTVSNYINPNLINVLQNTASSAESVGVHVSSTLDPSSPFILYSSTLLPSHRSHSSSLLHDSPVYSSTEFSKSTPFLSSNLFSDYFTSARRRKLTTLPPELTTFPSSTDAIRSTLITTPVRITSEPHVTSTMSTLSSITTHEQSITTTFDSDSTSQFASTEGEISSLSYVKSTNRFSTKFLSLITTVVPSTNLDTSEVLFDQTSTPSTVITTNEENFLLSTEPTMSSVDMIDSSSVPIDSFEYTSTSFPEFYDSTTFTPSEELTTAITYQSTAIPVIETSTHRYRTRKQRTTTWKTEPISTTLSTTASITLPYQTTLKYDEELTSSAEVTTDTSEWITAELDQTLSIQPSSVKNDSNTVLSNDLLNQLFNNLSSSSNSSAEKFIYVNLADQPPSSWNLSLNSNDSVVLDVVLPSSLNPNETTNLTFTNIEANTLVTNIVGTSFNLHVDRVQSKQFLLNVNATDNGQNPNRTKPYLSDVIIGHVRSEQFELNLTKTDNMHVQVKQVDSATADLFFDSNFCTNESSLEINLNLSQNGTIRYGNRSPIRIGAVFARVHMLKQSCDLEQPLTLFFDICERQNPCINDGKCVSVIPNYSAPSYYHSDVGDVGYKCECPLHTSGEHCQNLEYPLGYCLNGATLFQIYDRFNKSIEKCICTTGFRGEHCEENIDNCIGITCSDQGICEDGIDKYTCSCFEGFLGINCERKHAQTVLIQAASRSFGVVAILLIVAIGGLVVASDIHTYLTNQNKTYSLPNRMSRVSSELFENSVLLLGFSDAPIEMTDLSTIRTGKKSTSFKQRHSHRTNKKRKQAGYQQLSRKKTFQTVPKSSNRRHLESSLLNPRTI